MVATYNAINRISLPLSIMDLNVVLYGQEEMFDACVVPPAVSQKQDLLSENPA